MKKTANVIEYSSNPLLYKKQKKNVFIVKKSTRESFNIRSPIRKRFM